MSAAAPPPSHPRLPVGYGGSYGPGDGSTSRGAASFSSSSNGSGDGPPSRAMPHIKDLTAKAQRDLNANEPLPRLLDTASASVRQADTFLNFRQPHLAYVEYLRASEILVNIIPRHKDAVALQGDRGRLYSLYKDLIKRVNSQQEQFTKIKEIVINDNNRSGIQPTSSNASLIDPYNQPLRATIPAAPSFHQAPYGGAYDGKRPLSMPAAPNGYDSLARRPVGAAAGSDTGRTTPDSLRHRPYVQPKPEGLHSGATGVNGVSVNGYACSSSADILNQRFARLRMSGDPTDTSSSSRRPESRASLASSADDSPVTMPSPTDYDSRTSFEKLTRVTSASSRSQLSTRPFGPRGMPPVTLAPSHPPKLPLNTQWATSMPKAPSPTYSPARNMQTPGSINPPRSTARSIVGTGGRSSSMASSASAYAPGANSDPDGYFPKPINGTNGVHPGPPVRNKSVHLPRETMIDTEKLFDYLKMYSVMLIDVRSRELFDAGHVYAQNVMCIEPAALRKNMSAEELADSLVLSPDGEQALFDRRHQYDLVVFYDQSTTSDQFLQDPETERDLALRYLHDALYEFNQDKPLQRPPILLLGGIEAWADMVGSQALAMSNTAATVAGQRPTQASRLVRRAPANDVVVRKRRMREYNPLDADEERRWLERARVESVAVDERPPLDEENEAAQVEDATPIIRSYEDFHRRFPEIEQQSMVQARARSPPVRSPSPPRRPPVPSDHTAPNIPSIPSRPAPALPRMSYSGVNDRSSSQNLPASRTSHLPAYISPRYLPQNIRLPRTGLVNFGVTCYMNATLQCLSATTPLSMFFLDEGYHSLVQTGNWKGSKGLMPQLYANLIRSLWKGDVESIRPTSFRSFCARMNSEWGLDRQQDAKEFFDFLVDCLHEDLNSNWTRTPLRALTTEQEMKRERMPKFIAAKTEWGRYTHREQSFLTSLFAGQHASRLRCTTCHFTSTTYEAFYSISVEIPRCGIGDIRDCLRSYCAEETLRHDEVWKCPRCNKEREATKQITLTRAPQYLVVHFKRFSASRGEAARKVRTPIDFPLHNLDLEPYMLPAPSTADMGTAAAQYGVQEVKMDSSMTPPYLYDAYAVLRHLGTTLTSGHYVAMVRDRARGCWRSFNDTRVDDFEPQERRGQGLKNEQAYIVFYQRVAPGSGR
ncbi:hypothetical protein LTR04_006520, partial [Oleoguttula sp. CCFEE 6159]